MASIAPPSIDDAFEPAEATVIDTPEPLDAFTHPKRRRILAHLAREEATTGEMADALELPRQQLYHHLQQLIDAGLVDVSREIEIGRQTIRCYRAVAERFEVRMSLPAADVPEP